MRYTHLFTPTESKGDNLHQYFTSNKYATCEILKRLASNNSEDDSVKCLRMTDKEHRTIDGDF